MPRLLPIFLLSLVALACRAPEAPLTPPPPTPVSLLVRDPAPADAFPISLPNLGVPAFMLVQDGLQHGTIVDTGAPSLLVSKEYAIRHGHPVRPSRAAAQDLHGTSRAALGQIHLDAFALPGRSVRNLDAFVLDFASLRKHAFDDRLDLLIGRDVLSRAPFTIDYPRRRMSFNAAPLPPPDGRDVLPLRTNRAGEWLVPVTIQDETLWLILDTATTGCDLVLRSTRAAQFPSTPATAASTQTSFFGQQSFPRATLATDLHLGRHRIENPQALLFQPKGPEILAAGILQRFAVTIDYPNRRIRFTAPEDSQ